MVAPPRSWQSERQAVWLETEASRVVLRRKTGPTFGDRSLEAYVGKRVKCSGLVIGYMLHFEKIEVLS